MNKTGRPPCPHTAHVASRAVCLPNLQLSSSGAQQQRRVNKTGRPPCPHTAHVASRAVHVKSVVVNCGAQQQADEQG
eukprot:1145477-Pelagomonas_calceolata.AAC.1